MQGIEATLVSLATIQSRRCRTPLNALARMAALKKMEYRIEIRDVCSTIQSGTHSLKDESETCRSDQS